MDKTDKLNQPLTREMFDRLDENDDGLFYIAPRKLVHIDDGAIAAAGQCMAKTFAPNGLLLDLMSSWRSHLPEGLVKQKLLGLGLNAEEMADNPDLFGAWLVLTLSRTHLEPLIGRARMRTMGIAMLMLPSLISPITSTGQSVSVSSHLGGLATGGVIGALISLGLLRRMIGRVGDSSG